MARKIKTVIVENGQEKEVEIEVPDGPPAAWGDPDFLRLLGKRNPRVEGPLKVTGRARYTADVVLPGMLYARFLASPLPAATIASVDVRQAELMHGVKAVVVRPETTIRYAGQLIAAVAAVTPEIAEDACRAIKVTFQEQPFVIDQKDSRTIRRGQERREGDVDAAFRSAAIIHEGEYFAQTRLHCCLETHGHVAKWDGDRLTLWSSTQYIEGIRNAAAGAPANRPNVRVICEHMGGGFGSKFQLGPEGEACIELARKANRPVKLMLTRQDEQYANFRGPGARAWIRLAAAADGTILGADIRTLNEAGIEDRGTALDSGPYVVAAKSHRVAASAALINTAGQAALRAPGHPQAELLWGSALDDLAAKLNMDPLELRRKNHSDPVRVKEWEIGARVIGWDRRQKVPGSAEGVKKRGIGMGSAQWFGGGRKTADCTIHILPDGSVKSMSGVQDLGTGQWTYQASIVAEELGLELRDVTPLIGDSDYGPGHASGGSTTAPSVAPAIKMAAVDAREKMTLLAAKHLKAKPEEVELIVGGIFQVKGDPKRRLTWKQVCSRLPRAGLKAHGEWNSDLQAGGVAGCTFAEVEVDTETGKVEVLKAVGVQDCGFVLNRLQSESQVVGGIIQGIGTALLEERHMDVQTGRMLNANFEEYKLCGAMEAGGVNVNMDPPYRTLGADERAVVAIVIDNPTGKVSGIGEPACIAVQAAIANAVFNAIGVRVTDNPITPDRVLAALAKKRGIAA